MSKFVFVRHGQSVANAKAWVATPDTPLSDLGIEQARKTGEELKGMGIKTIVCSNMLRAQQTAETIAGELGVPIDHIKIINELHERRFPSREGKPRVEPSEWFYTTNTEDVEQQDVLIKRIKVALGKIKDMAKEGSVLVVGHGCSGFYLLEIATGKNDFKDFGEIRLINNADYIEVEL